MIQLPLELTDLDVVVEITGPGDETRDESVEEMEDRKKNEEAEDSGIDAVEEIQERRDSEVADDSGDDSAEEIEDANDRSNSKTEVVGETEGKEEKEKT